MLPAPPAAARRPLRQLLRDVGAHSTSVEQRMQLLCRLQPLADAAPLRVCGPDPVAVRSDAPCVTFTVAHSAACTHTHASVTAAILPCLAPTDAGPIQAPPAMHMHVHRCTLAQCRGREFTIEDCVTPVAPITPLHRPWRWASSCYTRAQTRVFRHPCTRCRRAATLDSVLSCHFPASCGYHPALCATFAAAPPSTRMMVCSAEPRDCWPHETCSVRNSQRV